MIDARSIMMGFVACVCCLQLNAQQSTTIVGAGSLAKDCYIASQAAAAAGRASRVDLDSCNKAIFHAALNKTQLAATYSNRGVIYMAMKDIKAAYKDYEKSLKISDELGEAFINRGNWWFAVQRFENAIADYGKAIELGSNKPHVALLNRGMAREQLGYLQQAKTDYLAALDLHEGWTHAQDKLARVSRKLAKKASLQAPQ